MTYSQRLPLQRENIEIYLANLTGEDQRAAEYGLEPKPEQGQQP